MIERQKYPPPPVIAVDIDGTLISQGRLNFGVIAWLQQRKKAGMRLMLWSSRGREYAKHVVEQFGLQDIFDDVISKPGYILDDQQWGWTRYTVWIPPAEINQPHGHKPDA